MYHLSHSFTYRARQHAHWIRLFAPVLQNHEDGKVQLASSYQMWDFSYWKTNISIWICFLNKHTTYKSPPEPIEALSSYMRLEKSAVGVAGVGGAEYKSIILSGRDMRCWFTTIAGGAAAKKEMTYLVLVWKGNPPHWYRCLPTRDFFLLSRCFRNFLRSAIVSIMPLTRSILINASTASSRFWLFSSSSSL